MRILLVEDDLDIVSAMQEYLEMQDHFQVVTVSSVKDLEKVLDSNIPFSMSIIDFILRDGTIEALLPDILGNPRLGYTLFVSASCRKLIPLIGDAKCLSKPFRIEDLDWHMNECISLYGNKSPQDFLH